MKKVQQNLKRWPGMIGMMCLLAVMLSSCLKNNDKNVAPAQVSGLAVVNASPDAPALGLYMDNTQVNQTGLVLGNYINYFSAYSGTRQATFRAIGSSTTLATDAITLAQNHSYTLFISNLIATPDFTLLTDSVNRPDDGTAQVRFVNMSSDAPAADLVVKGGEVIVSNKAYKAYSDFKPFSIAPDSLQVVKTGTNTVLATVPYNQFRSGAVYTVFLYGLANTADATKKLGATIMLNAYYN